MAELLQETFRLEAGKTGTEILPGEPAASDIPPKTRKTAGRANLTPPA
jgi:hypothetical protein